MTGRRWIGEDECIAEMKPEDRQWYELRLRKIFRLEMEISDIRKDMGKLRRKMRNKIRKREGW